MKRIGNIYPKIYDMENLQRAFKVAEKKAKQQAKKSKEKERQYLEIKNNKDFYLKQLQESLINKTYKTSKYKVFKKYDSGKVRKITDLPFYPDRITHWALMFHIEPIFSRLFIHDTYAAIAGKGSHKALYKLHKFMKDKEGTKYCLKLDIKKYFNNIDKEALKQMLRRYIKCKDTLWLLDEIIDSYPQGIPIGNYTSQYFGNFFLTRLDHWLKEEKRVKYYLRYMDDMIILASTKAELHKLKNDIAEYIKPLGLELKHNYQVFPTEVRGVDYVGYRSFCEFTLLRKCTKKRMKKAARVIKRRAENKQDLTSKNIGAFASYNGILKHCSSFHLRQNSLSQVEKYIKKEIKKCKTTKKLSEVKKTSQKN